MGRQCLAFQWPKERVLISATDFSTINFSIRIPPVAMTLVFGHRKVYFYSLAVVCTFCIAVRNVSPMQKPCLSGFSALSRWGFIRSTRQYLSSALLLFLHSSSWTLISSFLIPWAFACPVLATLFSWWLWQRLSGAHGRAWDMCHMHFYRPFLLHCFVSDLFLSAQDLFLPSRIGRACALQISSWSN